MGRGLSQQQRAILALARAFNATQRGGTPAVQRFDYHAMPGDVFPRQPNRIAAAELGWAVELPDYHDSFGLWVLCGFRSVRGDWYEHWKPGTFCRKRRTSMARAVDGLLDRGMLCHAMSPCFALSHFATDGVVSGWGTAKNISDPFCGFAYPLALPNEHPLRVFWYHGSDSWPAYWLTEAGHNVADTVVCEFDADGLIDAYHASREVYRSNVGRRGWWMPATTQSVHETLSVV